MPDGKIRHHNHIIDQQACRFLHKVFPDEWVQRTMSPDYGIDIDLELFGYEDGKCVTLGEHVFLQVKGTECAKYSTICPFGNEKDGVNKSKDRTLSVLKYSIEVPLLKLVERMGSALPVLLTVVDLKNQVAYYICLNDYIRHVLPLQNPLFRNQDYVTIYIPTNNVLTSEDSSVGLWYGKRAKLYGLFQDLSTLTVDVQYVDTYEKIYFFESRFNQIVDSDAWKVASQWPLIQWLHKVLKKMLQNGLIADVGENMLKHLLPNGADPFKVTVEYGCNGDLVSAITAAMLGSCEWFLEQAKAVISSFENNLRHMGLPTQFNCSQLAIDEETNTMKEAE